MVQTMVSEAEREELIRTTFRRDSLKKEGVEVIESWRIPGILGQMGQPFEQVDLDAALKRLDPTGSGKLDEDAYHKLCDEFVIDPAACAKFQGDEFAFKHLISLNDFARP